MRFDTKIAVVLSGELETWQKLNVTAFLAGGVATTAGVIGEPYADADGTPYLPLFRQPVLVFTGGAGVLAAVHARAVERQLPTAVFTRDMFATGHDAANREVVAKVARVDLDLAGIAVRGPRNAVDKVVKGAVLHP